MTRSRPLFATIVLTLLPVAAAAQADPPPDVADTIDEALQDTTAPLEVPESRIDPETVRKLEEMFGAEGILVVDDPAATVEDMRAAGIEVEVVTPGIDQIQPYSPNPGGGSDWLSEQIATADYLDQHQKEREQKRAALRMATGVVIVFGILFLMLRKPWESKELPRQAPQPPAPDEGQTEAENESERDSGDTGLGNRGAPGGREGSAAEIRGEEGDRADHAVPSEASDGDRAPGTGREDESGGGLEGESENEAEGESETESDSDSETETEPEPETETEPETESKP